MIILIGLSAQHNSTQVMYSMMRLLDYSLDIFIEGFSHEDSCHECMGSRSMVSVYSEEGEELLMVKEIDFPVETVIITVHEPT